MTKGKTAPATRYKVFDRPVAEIAIVVCLVAAGVAACFVIVEWVESGKGLLAQAGPVEAEVADDGSDLL